MRARLLVIVAAGALLSSGCGGSAPQPPANPVGPWGSAPVAAAPTAVGLPPPAPPPSVPAGAPADCGCGKPPGVP